MQEAQVKENEHSQEPQFEGTQIQALDIQMQEPQLEIETQIEKAST